ncbi:hypothetical protein ABB37_04993 [Leptomonas pyrrhocoris]|uniref:Uncharacterized protein n=1 Tax=Leptomonas pyrrhocoris TaxID=157538 RepID=A0A0N0VF35_LEPPY|nr:hypothetical protein ABB37_04993 [Leptomonas pyrrhocoris]KPA79944.1 hypothetical protein ABB37_04993 [Leptomonas pyrrhocoris]|eukprot:XP_015658383.1 hypothetical protein ABB37_04993 [Leptomonas pyrrhocoris]
MNRDAPPSLRFTRQWTQPTDLEHQTLSKVVYPPQQLDSPSPSPRRLSRTPLCPSSSSPLLPQHRGSSTRPTRRPPAVSSTASPLPTQPPPSLAVGVDRTPRRGTPSFTSSPVRGEMSRHGEAPARESDDAGRLFWQQQAQRFREANAVLRQELNAVYRALNDTGQRRSETAPDGGGAALSDAAWHHFDDHRPPAPHTNSTEDALSYEAVVQQRNVARIELAQEREKNFLLRHRLRESEMEVERLAGRLRGVGAAHSRRRPAPALYPAASTTSAAAAPGKAKARPPTRSPPHPSPTLRRSDSRRAASPSSSPTSSAESSTSSSLVSASRRRRTSSPRSRGITHRQSSSRSNSSCGQRSDGVSSVERSTRTAFSGVPRLSRGYARIQHRSEAPVRRSYSSSSSRSHRTAKPPSPLAPAQEDVLKAAPSSLSANHPVVPQRESKARALLSSLLAAHPPSALEAAFRRHQDHGNTKETVLSETVSSDEASTPRYIFRSRLFGEGDAAHDENALVTRDSSRLQEASQLGVREAYVARQLLSPTPPSRSSRSSAEIDGSTNALAQRLSSSGAWMPVSVTTVEGRTSRGLSLREEIKGGVAEPSTYRSFSF